MKYSTLIILFFLNQGYSQKLYPLDLTKNNTNIEAITILNLSSTSQLIDSIIYTYDSSNRLISELHFDRTEKKKEIQFDYNDDLIEKTTTAYRKSEIANRFKESYTNRLITQLEFYKHDEPKITVHYLRDKYMNLFRKEHYLNKRKIREEVITNIYSKEYKSKFKNIEPTIPLTNMIEEYQVDLILYNFTDLRNIKAEPDSKNTSKYSVIGDTIFVQNYEDEILKSESKLIQRGKYEDHELKILKGKYEIITNQKIFPDSLVYSYTALKVEDNGSKSIIQLNTMTETSSFNLILNTIYNSSKNNQIHKVQYEYKYDEQDNWTLRTRRENGQVISHTKRIIKYNQ